MKKTSGFHLELCSWLPFNKLLNFVPATKSATSTGLPALRQPISNALGPFMGVLEHSQATLRIFGDDLIPEDVSNLLGAKATKSKKKGDEEVGKSSGKVHIAKTGSWHLHAGKREPEDLNAQIEEILSQLTNDLTVWEGLCQSYKVDMFCGLFMGNWNDGLSLSPEIILALGQRRIVLSLDIYSGADD